MTDIHNKVSDEQVRELAQQLWEEGGRQEGRDQEYWYRAREILEAEAKLSSGEPEASGFLGAEIISAAD